MYHSVLLSLITYSLQRSLSFKNFNNYTSIILKNQPNGLEKNTSKIHIQFLNSVVYCKYKLLQNLNKIKHL